MDTPNAGGILNINKPSGPTSFQVIKVVRRILGQKKVGHCGTLDPLASGVLVVLYGRATRLSAKLMSGPKVYSGEMLLGVRTDTGDVTGRVLETAEVPALDSGIVLNAFERFTGEQAQVPPMFSAVKLKGKKLYDYARSGIEVARAPRTIHVFSLDLLELKPPVVRFRVACSKGTYVRSLVEDAGSFLGLPATLKSLVREQSGGFSIGSSIGWEALTMMNREELLSRAQACTAES